MIRWSTADLADAIASGLEARAREADLQQAVYGIDVLDELGLHPLVQGALRDSGLGVWPEQRYPSDQARNRKSEGKRCDIVLTAPVTLGAAPLPLRDPDIAGTLFENQPAVDPRDAFWLEIKTVAQFEAGVPFSRFASELLSTVTQDVRKLWADERIRHGGLALLLFTRDQQVAEHDLEAWHERCLDRGFPVAPPAVRGFGITDRIGNGWCGLGVFGVRG